MSEATIIVGHEVNSAVAPRLALFLKEDKRISAIESRIRKNTLGRFIKLKLKEPINPILDSERDYQSKGLSTLSIPQLSKARVTPWKEFQKRQSSDAFSPESNIAIVCGLVSGNLAVIDSETEADFDWVCSELKSQGIDTWIVRTARGGHCYLRTSEPISGRTLRLDGRNIEIRGEGQYVLAPPSVHPAGIVYQFMKRPSEIATVTFEHLRFLGVHAPVGCAGTEPMAVEAKRNEWIPPHVWRRLQNRCPEYSTRNKQDASTILSLILLGKTREQILELFEKHLASGRYLDDKEEFLIWFVRAYISARRKADAGDSEATRRTRAEMLKILPMVAVMPWTGRGAINERKVLLACLEIAVGVGNLEFNASDYRLSEVAMIKTRQTVTNARRRLQALGYIIKLKSGSTAHRASTYRIESSEIEKRAQNCHVPSSIEVGTWQSYALFPELFSSKVFPSCSDEVYKVIRAEACTAAVVVTRTGRCTRTVRGSLKVLRTYGLIRKQHGKYEMVESCDLKELARFLDVENARDALREKHRTLREKRFDKSGELKTEALKVALETADEEMQRFILCPPVAGVH